MEVAPLFGGTDPPVIIQDSNDGSNDIKSAKATVMAYPYVFSGLDRD